MFYDRFLELCESKGIKPTTLLKSLKVSPSISDNWKKPNTYPKGDTLMCLADCFNVSVDYLLGRTEIRETVTAENQFKIKKAPSLTDEEKQLLDDYRELYDDTKRLLRGLIANLKKGDAERKITKKQDNIF